MDLFLKQLSKIKVADFIKVLKIIPEPIIVTDTTPFIIYVNPALEKLTGYSLSELKGKNPRILRSGQTPLRVYQNLYKALTSGKPFTTREVINKRKDGSIYQIDASYIPIYAGDKPVFYVQIQHDITAHKNAEAELAKHALQLEDLNRAKDEFVSSASHSLRTPLSTIAWSIEQLLEDKKGYSIKLNKSLDRIYNQTQRMIQLTNDLLDATKIELGVFPFKYEVVNPLDIASDVILDLNDQISVKKIKFQTDFGRNIVAYKTYSNAIYLILHNLLSNAVKFTPPGGRVSLKIARAEKQMIFQISDSGLGIPKSAQKKIFQKMYRADNVKGKIEGNGLGLYITKKIVDRLYGKISFTSEQNKGTTFKVLLPLN